MGQNIVENQQQTLRQQPQSAQNEFDYYPQEQIAPQQQAPQDYIYPDHTYEPEETSARKALEEKETTIETESVETTQTNLSIFQQE